MWASLVAPQNKSCNQCRTAHYWVRQLFQVTHVRTSTIVPIHVHPCNTCSPGSTYLECFYRPTIKSYTLPSPALTLLVSIQLSVNTPSCPGPREQTESRNQSTNTESASSAETKWAKFKIEIRMLPGCVWPGRMILFPWVSRLIHTVF